MSPLHRLVPVGLGAALGILLTGRLVLDPVGNPPTPDAEEAERFAEAFEAPEGPTTTASSSATATTAVPPADLLTLLPDLSALGMVRGPGPAAGQVLADAEAAAHSAGDSGPQPEALAEQLLESGFTRGVSAVWVVPEADTSTGVFLAVYELATAAGAEAVGEHLTDLAETIGPIDPGVEGAGGYRIDAGDVHGVVLHAVRGGRVLRVSAVSDGDLGTDLARSALAALVATS